MEAAVDGTPRKVLVIDDDDDIREVTQVALRVVGGWSVSTAATGAEGLAMAARETPDVILLDVMMPDLDGPATLNRLRADAGTREVPVILLTAKATHDGDWPEAAGVLAKPFDPMRLPARIAELLGWAT